MGRKRSERSKLIRSAKIVPAYTHVQVPTEAWKAFKIEARNNYFPPVKALELVILDALQTGLINSFVQKFVAKPPEGL